MDNEHIASELVRIARVLVGVDSPYIETLKYIKGKIDGAKFFGNRISTKMTIGNDWARLEFKKNGLVDVHLNVKYDDENEWEWFCEAKDENGIEANEGDFNIRDTSVVADKIVHRLLSGIKSVEDRIKKERRKKDDKLLSWNNQDTVEMMNKLKQFARKNDFSMKDKWIDNYAGEGPKVYAVFFSGRNSITFSAELRSGDVFVEWAEGNTVTNRFEFSGRSSLEKNLKDAIFNAETASFAL